VPQIGLVCIEVDIGVEFSAISALAGRDFAASATKLPGVVKAAGSERELCCLFWWGICAQDSRQATLEFRVAIPRVLLDLRVD
jgi:hypothetical protein